MILTEKSAIRRSIFHSIVRLFNPFIRLSNKINWRAGRPYRCHDYPFVQVKDSVKPGMVILSHKEYELTNLFIRGYWTHAAMVISEDMVVEAVSKGVVKKPLKEFISTLDDFTIIRPGNCDHEEMALAGKYIQYAIGYPYNFTFKSRDDSYYCSELIYRAYMKVLHTNIFEKHFPSGLKELNRGNILIPQNLAEYYPEWQTVEL